MDILDIQDNVVLEIGLSRISWISYFENRIIQDILDYRTRTGRRRRRRLRLHYPTLTRIIQDILEDPQNMIILDILDYPIR